MSVPGRIGTILIIVLALLDAAILASGAKHAANALETGTATAPTVEARGPDQHCCLLTTALHRLNALRAEAKANLSAIGGPPESPDGI